MVADPKLVAARRDAELARQRLLQSAHLLQERVAPSRLANDALDTARERGTAVLDTVTAAARRQPRAATAIGLGLLAFVARRRIFRLFRRKPRHHDQPSATPRRALPRPPGDKA